MKKRPTAPAVVLVAGVVVSVLLIGWVLTHTWRVRVQILLWGIVILELMNLLLRLAEVCFRKKAQSKRAGTIEKRSGGQASELVGQTVEDRANQSGLEAQEKPASADDRGVQEPERTQKQSSLHQRTNDAVNNGGATQIGAKPNPKTPKAAPEKAASKREPMAESSVPIVLANPSSLYYAEATAEFRVASASASAHFLMEKGGRIVLNPKRLGKSYTMSQIRGQAWDSVFEFKTALRASSAVSGSFRLKYVLLPAEAEALSEKGHFRLTQKGMILIDMEE